MGIKIVCDIKFLRLSRKITQNQLAMILDVPLKTLQGWEGGKPAPSHVVKVINMMIDNDYAFNLFSEKVI